MMMMMCSLRENVLKCFLIIKCKDYSFGMEKLILQLCWESDHFLCSTLRGGIFEEISL